MLPFTSLDSPSSSCGHSSSQTPAEFQRDVEHCRSRWVSDFFWPHESEKSKVSVFRDFKVNSIYRFWICFFNERQGLITFRSGNFCRYASKFSNVESTTLLWKSSHKASQSYNIKQLMSHQKLKYCVGHQVSVSPGTCLYLTLYLTTIITQTSHTSVWCVQVLCCHMFFFMFLTFPIVMMSSFPCQSGS